MDLTNDCGVLKCKRKMINFLIYKDRRNTGHTKRLNFIASVLLADKRKGVLERKQ